MGEEKKIQPLEDRALKVGVKFFGQEALPLLGIKEEFLRIAPTEEIYLEMKQFLEDFNFEMENGNWYHFEFESDSITEEDLRRFHAYEAVTSFHYGVVVYTYVICTAKVKQLRDSISGGHYTYRVHIICMKDHNADEILERLEDVQKDRFLQKEELVWMLLTPLMNGTRTVAEYITKCAALLKKEQKNQEKQDFLRMEAILYAFAVKFLSSEELKKVKEVLSMTLLGQMIWEDGEAAGLSRGITQVAMNLLDILDDKTISEKTELSAEKVAELRREAGK